MDLRPHRQIGRLLADFVPKGDDDSPQGMGRMALNMLLNAMCARDPKHHDTPTTMRECIDRAQASVRTMHPGFVFEYDSQLLDADPRQSIPA